MSDWSKLDDRGVPVGYNFKPQYERTPRDARASIAAGAALLIDCRTKEEFELVHIPGSVHIPLHELEDRIDEIEPAQGQEVLVICHHGVRSMKAALALRQHGHPDAKSVAGGIELWSLAADHSVPRYERGPGVLRLI